MGVFEIIKSNISQLKINNFEETIQTLFSKNSLELASIRLMRVYLSLVDSSNLEIN